MSETMGKRAAGDDPLMGLIGSGPSEPESHTEHQAALDATVFRSPCEAFEVVLELDAGQLRLRPVRQD